MSKHVDFLREESEIALSDGCPVAAGRLTRAADALEQAQNREQRLFDGREEQLADLDQECMDWQILVEEMFEYANPSDEHKAEFSRLAHVASTQSAGEKRK